MCEVIVLAEFLKYVIIKEKEGRFMEKNNAFSFAEVMITLVIVGVVSLLVVPNLLDDSTTKFNDTAAKKARHDVYQAALMLQARCPRHRGCANITNELKALLPDRGDTKYKFNGMGVIIDADGDGTTDLHFTLNSDGSITEDGNCKLGASCSTIGITTFTSANGYSR